MKVVRWDEDLIVRIPASIAEIVDLKEGDEFNLVAGGGKIEVILQTRADRIALLESLRKFSGRFPEGWKFDREEANAR